MAKQQLTSQQEKVHALFETLGIKGELGRAARRLLVTTPEYEQARRERRARAWLDREASSMADMLYEAAQQRLEDLES